MRFVILLQVLLFVSILILNCSRTSAEQKTIDINVGVGQDTADTAVPANISSILLEPDDTYVEDGDADVFSVSVPVSMYRGSTLKRTVYVWIEDLSGKRISSKHKFSLPSRFTIYNLSANLNVSGSHESGEYLVVASGLDIVVNKSVLLRFSVVAGPGSVSSGSESVNFSFVQVPFAVESGVPFIIRVLMRNPSQEDLEVDAWSYVYKASKCYSGEREANRVTLNLPESSDVTFDLENVVAAPPGEYIIKVKFLRSDRKTEQEIRQAILVRNATDRKTGAEDGIVASSGAKGSLLAVPRPVTGNDSDKGLSGIEKRALASLAGNGSNSDVSSGLVYMSSSAKARRIVGYILMVVLALVLVALLLKRF